LCPSELCGRIFIGLRFDVKLVEDGCSGESLLRVPGYWLIFVMELLARNAEVYVGFSYSICWELAGADLLYSDGGLDRVDICTQKF